MHLVIVQTPLAYMDNNTYNRQETGLAKALVKLGFKCSLIFTGREEKTEVVQDGIVIHYLTCKKLNQQFGTYIGLWKKLDELKPDLVQIHEIGMFMSFYALRWTQKKKVPCVVIQGPYELTRKPLFKQLEWMFDKTFGRYILKHIAGVGCKTEAAAKFIQNFRKSDYVITPVGLDASRFANPSKEYNLREQLGIPQTDKVLLYIGVNEKRRHVRTLIDAVEKLPSNYSLVVVGEGSQKEILKQYVQEHLSHKKIHWLSKRPQSELPSIYKAADLFLLASDYEIYGMVILEAMYYNVPVLSTKTGGAVSLIEDKETGYLIDGFDGKKWAGKIERIFNEKDTYEKIKKGSRDYILRELLWEQTAPQFVKLYNNALDKWKK